MENAELVKKKNLKEEPKQRRFTVSIDEKDFFFKKKKQKNTDRFLYKRVDVACRHNSLSRTVLQGILKVGDSVVGM